MKYKYLSVKLVRDTYKFRLLKEKRSALLQMAGNATRVIEIDGEAFLFGCDAPEWRDSNVSYMATLTGSVYLIEAGYNTDAETDDFPYIEEMEFWEVVNYVFEHLPENMRAESFKPTLLAK